MLLLGTACDPASDPVPEPREGPQTTSYPVDVTADFGVGSASPDELLRTVGAETIQVGRGAAGVIAVERPREKARCVVAAQLRLYLPEASELVASEIAIYPSHVFNAASKRDGERFGYAGTALDSRPRSVLDEVGTGWTGWDVTDIVKLWLRGGPFPSQGGQVPKRGPIVFAIRDVDLARPFAEARFVSADGPRDRRPHMLVATRCVAQGRPDQ